MREICYVSSLDLRQNKLKNEGIKVLAKALKTTNSLVHLDLRSTAFSKEGADSLFEALICNQSLTCLRIGCIKGMNRNFLNGRALEGIQPFLKNTLHLTFLDLKGAGIGNESFKYLAEGLKKCKSLCIVDLSLNNLDYNSSIPIIEVIAMSIIKHIDLSQNPLGNSFILEMDKRTPMKCSSLTHLNFSFCDFSYPYLYQLFNTLKKLPFLEELETRGAIYKEQDLRAASWFLTSTSKVKKFCTAYSNIGDDGLKCFVDGFVPAYVLQELDFSNNKITNLGASLLAEKMLHVNLKRLRTLNLSQNSIEVVFIYRVG